jgi:hypothetical protein
MRDARATTDYSRDEEMKMIEPCARNKAMRVALAKTALALMTIIGLVGCDSNGASPGGEH